LNKTLKWVGKFRLAHQFKGYSRVQLGGNPFSRRILGRKASEKFKNTSSNEGNV